MLLSRARAIELARVDGVEEADAERLLGLASAAWRLARPDDPGAAAVVVGGEPAYLSDDERPRNEHGAPLTLIARIDTGRLPTLEPDWAPIPAWAHHGARLDVFADREFGSLMVVVLERPAEGPITDGLCGGVACAAVPCVSLPSLSDEDFDDDFDALGNYIEWCHLVAYDGAPPYPPAGISTVLGEPDSVQVDALFDRVAWQHSSDGLIPTPGLDDAQQWRVLLHLASDLDTTGFDFGGGALTIAVPGADLAAGRYDRAVGEWQF